MALGLFVVLCSRASNWVVLTVADSIEFSLCLDSLTASDELHLHISKLGTKEPRLQALYDVRPLLFFVVCAEVCRL